MSTPWYIFLARAGAGGNVKAALAGLAEITEMLGVSKRSVQRYAARPDFPKPIAQLASGPVWEQPAIRAWAEQRLPLRTGRPARGSRSLK
jgi:predicted DNA-binding transcriptional regulator AlpA